MRKEYDVHGENQNTFEHVKVRTDHCLKIKTEERRESRVISKDVSDVY